jgi:1-acyl-sn-glycerol-3-phosphate acyltransferase
MQVAGLMAAWTLGLVILGPVLLLLMHTLPPGLPIRLLSRVVSRIMVTLSGCRVEVDGSSRMPKRGPLVLVSNHTSYADTPVLLSALPIDFVFVAMKEILSWRVVGTLARRGRHPTVDRWQAQRSVADAAAVESRLRSGEALLFFAEGGFRQASGLRPFRLGAFRAAVASGAPVVQIALRGGRRILAEGARLPRPGRISVWIGDPLMPTGTGWRAIVDLRNRTADQIALHCGEPRLQV